MIDHRIRIGYWDRTCRETLWFPHDSHLMLTAPSGSGKFTNVLGPLGMLWQGSTIWIDPKLQAAAVLGRHLVKNLKHRVLVLNPFDILGRHLKDLTPAQCNPMDDLDPALKSFGTDCESLADGVIWEETRGPDGNHWSLSAKDLVAGVTGALAMHGRPNEKSLAAVRRVICGDVFGFCRSAMATNCEFIRQKLARFCVPGSEDNKEILGIISTAITQSSFIGNAAIADNLSTSTFRFRDLKKRPTTIFLGLPAPYLSTCGKWFRLIVASAMNQLLHEERGVPVLMVLDEFAQLGRLKVIENAMALARGYGVQLLPVLQDLNQLKGLYGESYQTFLANAGCRIFFAPQDKFTSDYLSDQAGETEVRGISKSLNQSPRGRVISGTSYAPQKRRYLLPQEVRELPGDEMLVFGTGLPGVLRAGRRPYYLSPEFKGMYDADPYYVPHALPTAQRGGGFLSWLFN